MIRKPTQSIDAADLLRRALSAYYRTAPEAGGRLLQHSDASGVLARGALYYVVVRNSAVVLAVYRVRNDRVLRRMRRWPKALEVFSV